MALRGGFEAADGGQTAWAGLAASLDESDPAVLPQVDAGWLQHAMTHLSPAERALALRHRIVALDWRPEGTVYGVATAQAWAEARRRRLAVAASIAPDDYTVAVGSMLSPTLLDTAVHGLAHAQPALSAHQRLTPWQAAFLVVALAALAWFVARGSYSEVVIALSLSASVFFAMVISLRAFCVSAPVPRRSAARRLSDAELPTYSVLVPLFRELSVLRQLLTALYALDYPADKLDIKLVLEEDDQAMRAALERAELPAHMQVIVVPRGKPQTKPRALNYALQFARGSLLTIYDSEDIPDPDQLRKAAQVFAAHGPQLACLQARLTFYNPNENWLTRQFTAEYAGLFEVVLPALARRRYPLLLGGTSNHFRTATLRQVGAWDAFNVTEDADLGLRLARLGYRVGMLDSATHEEGNTALGNWMRQRRRWMKGFLQTWLVHTRNPVQMVREIGMTGFWVLQCMTLGIFMSALLHPLLLAHSLYSLTPAQLSLASAHPLTASGIVLNISLLTMGYAVAMAISQVGLRRVGITGWLALLPTIPLYWLLMSIAAWLAIWDFIFKPFHWHKTTHGLSRMGQPVASKRKRPAAAG